LTQADMIESHNANLLDSIGLPMELYKGTLNVQSMPTALRLFESSWYMVYWHLNSIVRWVANTVCDYTRRQRMGVRLARPSMADNLEEKNIYMQLSAGGEISRQRAYASLNIEEPVEEIKRRMREDMDIERIKNKMQIEAQQEQMLAALGNTGQNGEDSGAPQAGTYGSPPGGVAVTPMRVMEDAAQRADQLLQIEDDGQRAKLLDQLRNTDQNLYYAVKGIMEDKRRQAGSQGRASVGQMVGQQQQG
jgi:hypothetical protein